MQTKQIKKNKLFDNPKDALEYGRRAKLEDRPEAIGILLERLLDISRRNLIIMQTNVIQFQEACFEYFTTEAKRDVTK